MIFDVFTTSNNLSENNYKLIFSNKSWDGVFASGIFSRIFDRKKIFRYLVGNARNSIILGVPFYIDASVNSSLIIDVFDCRKGILANVRMGNIIICDDSFASVTSLISDIFDVDVPEEFLDAVDNLNERIIDSDIEREMFYALLLNIRDFPYEYLASLVQKSKWEDIKKWIRSNIKQNKKEKLERTKKELESKLIEENRFKVILYDPRDENQVSASRLLEFELLDSVQLLVRLGMYDNHVKVGVIKSSKKKVNLLRLCKLYLDFFGKCGGRSNSLYLSQALQKISSQDFLSILETNFKTIFK